MKKLLFILLLFFILSSIKLSVFGDETLSIDYLINDNLDYPKNELIVVLNENSSSKWVEYNKNSFLDVGCVEVEDLTSSYNPNNSNSLSTCNNSYCFRRILKLTLDCSNNDDLINAIQILNERSDVEFVEPNYYVCNNLNDDLIFSTSLENNRSINTWGLTKINQSGALDILADYNNKYQITIGVIDAGIDNTHDDLQGQINTNSHSFMAGFYAYDCYDDHGTMTAGIISAISNNNIGIDGVYDYSNVMSLKCDFGYQYTNSEGLISQIISAINYANNNYVKILNCSFSFDDYLNSLKCACENYSGLIVCSAGNSNNNNDNNPVYPASFGLENIISVGCIDQNNARTYNNGLSGSNYGSLSVDLFAPGIDIYSTSCNNGYSCGSGTSFAAPYVAGVAAMIFSIGYYHQNGYFTAYEVKDIILKSVTPCSSLSGLCVTGGYLNAESAVDLATDYEMAYSYEYYDSDYHRVIPDCGISNLESHEWLIVLNNRSLQSILTRPLHYVCDKCGASKIE